jgi:predicted ATPase
MPVPLALGTIPRGWALVKQGRGAEGLAQIRQGLAAYRASGMALFQPHFLALLAEAYGDMEQAEEGLTVLDEALAVVEQSGERYWEGELHRLKGTLLLARSAACQAEAEAWVPPPSVFQDALALACRVAPDSRQGRHYRWAPSATPLWSRRSKKETCP